MSAVEMLYINDTALTRVQFPLYNWLEINKTKYSRDSKTAEENYILETPERCGDRYIPFFGNLLLVSGC
ncbi:hypothetical protein LC612_15550 [Nostoc sp. CHAB 5834]|nr:hypothetical protein [Nostoc sp. CHAB 5834]